MRLGASFLTLPNVCPLQRKPSVKKQPVSLFLALAFGLFGAFVCEATDLSSWQRSIIFLLSSSNTFSSKNCILAVTAPNYCYKLWHAMRSSGWRSHSRCVNYDKKNKIKINIITAVSVGDWKNRLFCDETFWAFLLHVLKMVHYCPVRAGWIRALCGSARDTEWHCAVKLNSRGLFLQLTLEAAQRERVERGLFGQRVCLGGCPGFYGQMPSDPSPESYGRRLSGGRPSLSLAPSESGQLIA